MMPYLPPYHNRRGHFQTSHVQLSVQLMNEMELNHIRQEYHERNLRYVLDSLFVGVWYALLRLSERGVPFAYGAGAVFDLVVGVRLLFDALCGTETFAVMS
jgi:hypothetical protein